MSDLLSTVIIPTERPIHSNDIKRALLLFDRVHVLAPDDRELLPPELFMQASIEASGFDVVIPAAFSAGSVLPLGKTKDHDEVFGKTLDECKPAVASGRLVVERAPVFKEGIGFIQPPPGWPPPAGVLHSFRQLASSADYLLAACKGIPKVKGLSDNELSLLAPGGLAFDLDRVADAQVPSIAKINDGSLTDQQHSILRIMAAARLGTVVKILGMCEITGLHAFCTDPGIEALVDRIQGESARSLGAALADASDAYVVSRAKRVERIVFTQESRLKALEALSVSDVLKLRTSAWGREAEHRAAFFGTVRKLANETESDSEFDNAVKERIKTYSDAATGLADELGKIKIKAGALAVIAVAGYPEFHNRLYPMPSWYMALAIAAIVAYTAKELGSDGLKFWRQHRDTNVNAGKVLMTPFKRLK